MNEAGLEPAPLICETDIEPMSQPEFSGKKQYRHIDIFRLIKA